MVRYSQNARKEANSASYTGKYNFLLFFYRRHFYYWAEIGEVVNDYNNGRSARELAFC